MADTKISALTAASAAAAANEYPINEAGTTKKVTGAQIKTLVNTGTTTNDNASAGQVGELIESDLLSGSAVSLSTATAKTITSISLTAGDWDVWGVVVHVPAGTTTVTNVRAAISTTNNALELAPAKGGDHSIRATLTTGASQILPTGTRRVSLASTTTIYLIGYAEFAVSTFTAYGYIGARRRR